MKIIFAVCFSLLMLLTTQMEAYWGCPSRRCGCRGRCYSDLTTANYDGIYYGYVDNINYPDAYKHPLNRCFRYCPPCPRNPSNYQYFLKCAYHAHSQSS